MLDDIFLNNPTLKGMSPEKLQFILSFAQKEKPTSMKDAMPFLIANMNLAKKQNINFSRPEVQLIAEILCKDLPPEEQERVRKLLSMMNNMPTDS